jgi:hypothetical protein
VKLSTCRIRAKWQHSHPCEQERQKNYGSAQEPDLNMKHWDFFFASGTRETLPSSLWSSQTTEA